MSVFTYIYRVAYYNNRDLNRVREQRIQSAALVRNHSLSRFFFNTKSTYHSVAHRLTLD